MVLSSPVLLVSISLTGLHVLHIIGGVAGRILLGPIGDKMYKEDSELLANRIKSQAYIGTLLIWCGFLISYPLFTLEALSWQQNKESIEHHVSTYEYSLR